MEESRENSWNLVCVKLTLGDGEQNHLSQSQLHRMHVSHRSGSVGIRRSCVLFVLNFIVTIVLGAKVWNVTYGKDHISICIIRAYRKKKWDEVFEDCVKGTNTKKILTEMNRLTEAPDLGQGFYKINYWNDRLLIYCDSCVNIYLLWPEKVTLLDWKW